MLQTRTKNTRWRKKKRISALLTNVQSTLDAKVSLAVKETKKTFRAAKFLMYSKSVNILHCFGMGMCKNIVVNCWLLHYNFLATSIHVSVILSTGPSSGHMNTKILGYNTNSLIVSLTINYHS